MNELKIAIVFDGMQYGGIERVGIDYIDIFRELGYDITLFNLRPRLSDMLDQIQNDVHVINVYYPRWLSPERYAVLVKKVWWGKFFYPIAYTVMLLINAIYRVALLGRYEFRKKYDIAIAFSGHINDLTIVSNSFIRCNSKLAWLHSALYSYAILSPGYLRLYAKIKNLVSISNMCDTDMDRFIQENSINKLKIYNPISIGRKQVNLNISSELKAKYGDFCLMVARMDDDKDQKTAIKAMRTLNTQFGIKKNLVLVGDGKTRQPLEALVKDLKMEDQIFFEGATKDVQNYYSAAYMLIHSSPLEGLPTVLLEAMYFKLPIVATNSMPGVPEVLDNGKYGLVSEVFDIDGLAKNIYELYTNRELYNKLSVISSKRLEDFELNVIKNQIKSYLESL